MRALAVGLLLFAGCLASGDDDDDNDRGSGSGSGSMELPCPGQAEVCGHRDGGFELHCADGAIEVADLTTTLYCRPGTTEELCQGPVAPRASVTTCTNGCGEAYRYFDSYDEYQSFDPQTLCQ